MLSISTHGWHVPVYSCLVNLLGTYGADTFVPYCTSSFYRPCTFWSDGSAFVLRRCLFPMSVGKLSVVSKNMIVSCSPSRWLPWLCLKLGHSSFLLHSFQFTSHASIWCHIQNVQLKVEPAHRIYKPVQKVDINCYTWHVVLQKWSL
jgi:hypothetical protein